jgi:hypothetical protein
MDEYDYDEGSDIDNWESEQVFQDTILEREEEEEKEEEKFLNDLLGDTVE